LLTLGGAWDGPRSERGMGRKPSQRAIAGAEAGTESNVMRNGGMAGKTENNLQVLEQKKICLSMEGPKSTPAVDPTGARTSVLIRGSNRRNQSGGGSADAACSMESCRAREAGLK